MEPCQQLVISTCKCGHLTKEISCYASVENLWDGKPRIIKCNDFCLLTERNRRVALALDIDEGVNRAPRTPNYDDYILNYAAANIEFTLKIEKRLSDWVSDPSAQSLNLPPMKGHHRKFIHELAGHYSVTSESVDVEPYRSVILHKKLNIAVPDPLASQACRQRRSVSTSSAISGPNSNGGLEQLRKANIKDPINAIYLHDIVPGLTRTELTTQLAPIFNTIKYNVRWLTDDDAVLIPQPGNLSMIDLEMILIQLRSNIRAFSLNGQLCERVELCWVNKEGQVVSHTSSSGSQGQAKKFFSTVQGSRLMKKPEPAKITNAFSVLDEDEQIAARNRAETERILKIKEAAGTLSLEAWEEDEAVNASFSSNSSSTNASRSAMDRAAMVKKVKAAVAEANQNVVDDWQELLDNDER
ncbi:FKBP12-associated protein [Mortierella claussenii]|nr:FKBP12-associated protein [Mortierella claussenii]